MKETLEYLKSKLNLTAVANTTLIDQNGDYLIFSGFERISANETSLKFQIVLARNTLDCEIYGILDEIMALGNKLLEDEAKRRAVILKSAETRFISESLYAYIFDLNFPIKRVK
jgi:putative cysteine repeat modular protein 1 pbCRM1